MNGLIKLLRYEEYASKMEEMERCKRRSCENRYQFKISHRKIVYRRHTDTTDDEKNHEESESEHEVDNRVTCQYCDFKYCDDKCYEMDFSDHKWICKGYPIDTLFETVADDFNKTKLEGSTGSKVNDLYTLEELDELEKKWGYKLPDEFRSYLTKVTKYIHFRDYFYGLIRLDNELVSKPYPFLKSCVTLPYHDFYRHPLSETEEERKEHLLSYIREHPPEKTLPEDSYYRKYFKIDSYDISELEKLSYDQLEEVYGSLYNKERIFTPLQYNQYVEKGEIDPSVKLEDILDPYQGTVEVEELGCQFSTFYVVTGKQAGTTWYHDWDSGSHISSNLQELAQKVSRGFPTRNCDGCDNKFYESQLCHVTKKDERKRYCKKCHPEGNGSSGYYSWSN